MASSEPTEAAPAAVVASRVEQVATTLGIEIVTGIWCSGQKLPIESEICSRFGIGRNAVREALKLLAGKHLVRTDGRAGTLVRPREEWNVLDRDVLAWSIAVPEVRLRLVDELTVLRRMIEPEVAALAAQVATITEILRLFEAQEAMRAGAGERERAIEADIRFHALLFEATHNQLLIGMGRIVATLLRINFDISIEAGDAFRRNLDDHREIAEAVHRRDPAAAREATLRLLGKNESDLAERRRATEPDDT